MAQSLLYHAGGRNTKKGPSVSTEFGCFFLGRFQRLSEIFGEMCVKEVATCGFSTGSPGDFAFFFRSRQTQMGMLGSLASLAMHQRKVGRAM